jgi:hypothetical protein
MTHRNGNLADRKMVSDAITARPHGKWGYFSAEATICFRAHKIKTTIA